MNQPCARVALLEHPRNFAAYGALERLSDLGIEVVLLTKDRHRFAQPRWWPTNPLAPIAGLIECDTSDSIAVSEALQHWGEEPALVMSFSHHYCAIAADVALARDLPTPTPDSVRVCVNKPAFRTLALNQPWTVGATVASSCKQVSEFAEENGWPVVLKPTAGASSTDVFVVNNDTETTAAWDRLGGSAGKNDARVVGPPGTFLLEAFADGPEFSVEMLITDGMARVYGVTAKTPLPTRAVIEQADTFTLADPTTSDVVSAAKAAVTMVSGFRGAAHVEVRRSSDGPKVIEVNPRQGGGHIPTLVELVTGRNTFVDQVVERLAIDVAPEPTTARAATWWQFYAEVSGVVEQIEPPLDHDGEVELFQTMVDRGDTVQAPFDNRDCIGSLVTTGANPSDSLKRARALASKTKVVVRG